MNLFLILLIGAVMIGVTVITHAIALDFIIKHARRVEIFLRTRSFFLWKPIAAGSLVIGVFSSHVVQIWLWALLYLLLKCEPLTNLSDALYFATVTYTTLGYGDITLKPNFRMLSGVEAINGIIMFGWTTAFIFEVISQIYRREARSI